MKVFSVIGSYGQWLRETLARPFMLYRLTRKYPTCRFSFDCSIDDATVFGRYNVISRQVTITDSIIGDHTFIQRGSIVHNAAIGKFCSIAMDVTIGPGQHPLSRVSSHPAFYSSTQPLVKTFSRSDMFSPFTRTQIGHDVWIGQRAIIMDGVTIQTGAVIGAGAVVTEDVPPYGISAGVPARIIGYRCAEDLREKLLKTAWWDMPEEWFEKHWSLFEDHKNFLRLFDID